MMDLSTIRQMAADAARKARREKKEPFVVFDAAHADRLDRTAQLPFPFLGTYVPKGWKKIDELFVDSSGFGAEDEPALTRRGMMDKIRELLDSDDTHGFAITQAGQFQVYVGVYKKVAVKLTRSRGAKAGKDVWPGDDAVGLDRLNPPGLR